MRETYCHIILVLLTVNIRGGLQENPMDLFFLEKASSLFTDYEEGIENSLQNLRKDSLDRIFTICRKMENESLNTFCLHSLKLRLSKSFSVPESEIDKSKITDVESFYVDISLYSNVRNIVILAENRTQDLINIQRLLMSQSYRVIACLGGKIHTNTCTYDTHSKLFIHLGVSCDCQILNSVRIS